MEKQKVESSVTVDDILQILGPFGKFNLYNFALVLLPVCLAGMYASVYNFEVMDLNYRCAIPECDEDVYTLNYSIPHTADGDFDRCSRYATNATTNFTCAPEDFDSTTAIQCDSFVYSEGHSIVKEFNLACQDWKRSLVGTVHNAGFFISIPLTGFLSDKFGRRMALTFASVASGVFGLIRALSRNFDMFVVFEFLEPAFGGGVYTACFVLALELVGPKGRVFTSLLFNFMFIAGGVTVTVLYWWLQSWRLLLFVIYTPAVLVFTYLFLLSESFRWYFSKGRYGEGRIVLEKAERMNGVQVPKEDYDQIEKQAVQQRDMRKFESADTSTFKQLLLSSTIWKRCAVCSFLWVSSTLVYYGLSINAIELSGSRYTNYIFVLLIEAPANICKLFLLDRFGRKRVIAAAYFITGVVLINYGFVPRGTLSITLYFGGKFFVTLGYNSLYVYAAEVFPTNYRTTLLALCSTVGRIGATLAPLTPLLTHIYEYFPTALFGVMTIISSVLVISLPETNNQKLPDSLKEAEDLDKGTENIEEKNEGVCKTRL